MNDHELDLALRDVYVARTSGVIDPPSLHERAADVPLTTPRGDGILPPLTRRFQTMFSATRFVLAGAVVALFGGLLAAGVLTQPSQEQVPAGASASAASVTPTQPVDQAPVVPPYLLTGEVEPGVLKVGAHEFVGTDQGEDLVARAFVGVALAADGTPWVLEAETGFGTPGRYALYRLGSGERHELADPDNVTADLFAVRPDLEVAQNGTLWARRLGDNSVLHAFDGGAWSETVSAGDTISGLSLGSDGTPFVAHEVVAGALHESVHRRPDGAWQALPPVDEGILAQMTVSWEPDGRTPPLGTATVGTDGEAWVPVYGGLFHHGPEGWSFHAPVELADTGDTYLRGGRLAVGPDGSVWYHAEEVGPGKRVWERHLARFDGSAWTVQSSEGRPFDLETGEGMPMLDPWAGMSVDGDGRVWFYGAQDADWVATEDQDLCPGVLSFDGREWRRYLRGACINDIAIGADGSVWAASYGTYLNRDDPELAGIFIIRP